MEVHYNSLNVHEDNSSKKSTTKSLSVGATFR